CELVTDLTDQFSWPVRAAHAVRNLDRAGVPRSVAMKLTGERREAVYQGHAIVAEANLIAAGGKLAPLHDWLARASTRVGLQSGEKGTGARVDRRRNLL